MLEASCPTVGIYLLKKLTSILFPLVTHLKSISARQQGKLLNVALLLVGLCLWFPPSVVSAQDALKIGELRVGKVLFLGNSITLHGPAPEIGWTGDWGMAASAREKDYVHLLLGHITKAAGKEPQVKVRNIADFERQLSQYKIEDGLKAELAFEADLIILAIGENSSAPTSEAAKKEFLAANKELMTRLTKMGKPKLIVRSQFWPDPVKDGLLQEACKEAGGTFVNIAKLGADPTNAAKSERQIEHAGVGGHPGDKGMAAIADALWDAIQKEAKSKK